MTTCRMAGFDISTLSRKQLTHLMVAECSRPQMRPKLVFSVNGQAIALREMDAEYREAVDSADLIHADGGFLVTLSKLKNGPDIAERSATTDLMHDFATAAQDHGLSFYLFGGTESLIAECERALHERYPRLRIVGTQHGYYRPEEEQAVVSRINRAAPDVLWIGLGKPKEQIFSARNAGSISAKWIVTCGGCFNFVTGAYRRAPEVVQRLNLEWVHRALTNPRQLLWRYMTTCPHALWVALVGSRFPRT